MLRRLHPIQPDSFAFTPANLAWAEGQITKYPEGRQASAVIPLLWRAQEQEGWVSQPAIEYVGNMLGMAEIRVLEVASFYFMFQLQPVGAIAHIQVCGTTSCMICGAEDLIGICQEVIAAKPHEISADGNFSWEEVECLGACANAPMAQIGKDYYEDLTAESFREILAGFARGEVPKPGPQNGRFSCEPRGGLTTLKDFTGEEFNGSVGLAVSLGDTVKRIQGDEVPVLQRPKAKAKPKKAAAPKKEKAVKNATNDADKPKLLAKARDDGADDLKKITGVGPKLEKELNGAGVFHFDQIANWTSKEIAWADENLVSFKGRITRDNWVSQAKKLMK